MSRNLIRRHSPAQVVGSKDWDLLNPNPPSVSMGYSQLNGVFCYLLVADKVPAALGGSSASCLGFEGRPGSTPPSRGALLLFIEVAATCHRLQACRV